METYLLALLAGMLIWPSLTSSAPTLAHRWATGVTGVCSAVLLVATLSSGGTRLWPATAELILVLIAIDGMRLWSREWQPAIAFALVIAHATTAGAVWTGVAAACALVGASVVATIEHAPKREPSQSPARHYN